MKQVYYPYSKWEEVKAGMYNTRYTENEKNEYIQKAVELLSSPAELKAIMKRTIVFWPYSTERKLTTPGLNKQAWLGQAACCLYAGVPEELTKEAWGLLSEEQRISANKVADEIYTEWERNYAENIQ